MLISATLVSVGCAVCLCVVICIVKKLVLNLDGSKGAGVSAARPPAAVSLRRRSAAVPSAYGNYAMLLWLPDCLFCLLSFGSILTMSA